MDPIPQPHKLKHLELRNRIITTSHEPAYPEDGMPKSCYIAYHVERARGGITMTMTAGPAALSKNSPPAFSNLGEVDYDQLINSQPQTIAANSEGAFQLYRIGDAVSSRNTHAAIYEALRLMREI